MKIVTLNNYYQIFPSPQNKPLRFLSPNINFQLFIIYRSRDSPQIISIKTYYYPKTKVCRTKAVVLPRTGKLIYDIDTEAVTPVS